MRSRCVPLRLHKSDIWHWRHVGNAAGIAVSSAARYAVLRPVRAVIQSDERGYRASLAPTNRSTPARTNGATPHLSAHRGTPLLAWILLYKGPERRSCPGMRLTQMSSAASLVRRTIRRTGVAQVVLVSVSSNGVRGRCVEPARYAHLRYAPNLSPRKSAMLAGSRVVGTISCRPAGNPRQIDVARGDLWGLSARTCPVRCAGKRAPAALKS